MIEEDQNHMCNNNSKSGGRGGGGGGSGQSSSKKRKREPPQRGFGMAKLQEIIGRGGEQHKNNGNNNNNNNISTSPTNLSTKCCSKHKNNQRTSKTCVLCNPLPLTPTIMMPRMNISHENPNFRACDSFSNIENFHLGSNSINNNGDSIQGGWYSNSIHGNFNFPNTQIQPPFHNSLVNAYPMNSLSSSSSFMNFSMEEPPSNQNFYYNYPPWPNDEKTMVGMKRPHLDPLDDPPIPRFNNNIAPAVSIPPLIESDDGPLVVRNGETKYSNLDCEPPTFRENSSKIRRTDKGKSHAQEDLSFAPRTITSSFPNPQFNNLPYNQASIEDTLIGSSQNGSSQNSNKLSLFASMDLQRTKPPSTPPPPAPTPPPECHDMCNGEEEENIDLVLKL